MHAMFFKIFKYEQGEIVEKLNPSPFEYVADIDILNNFFLRHNRQTSASSRNIRKKLPALTH